MNRIFLVIIAVLFSISAFADHGDSSACQGAQTVRALYFIDKAEISDDIAQLVRFACSVSEPTGSIYYPNGKHAFVGPEYSDKGSWKYPNGNYAFAGPGFSDHDSWKYPDNGYAFAGPGFSDHDSWKYPNGKYAYAGPGFSDSGSWKYPNGSYAFAGAGFSDHDSWKYSNGKYAFAGPGFSDHDSWKWPNGNYAFAGPGFSDHGTWYYPDHKPFSTGGTADPDARTLVHVVEIYKNIDCEVHNFPGFQALPEALKVLIRLNWVEAQLKE